MSVPPFPRSSYQVPSRVRLDAIGEAWDLLKQQMGTWIVAQVISYLVVSFFAVIGFLLLMSMASPTQGSDRNVLVGLLAVIGYAFLIFLGQGLGAGMYLMAIRQVRGETLSPIDVLAGLRYSPKVFGATLLMTLVIAVGTVFLILPGMIAAGLLSLTIPLIVDGRRSVIGAMQESWNLLRQDMWMALIFAWIVPMISGLGAILCGIGVVFTVPLMFLAHALVYRDFCLRPAVENPTW